MFAGAGRDKRSVLKNPFIFRKTTTGIFVVCCWLIKISDCVFVIAPLTQLLIVQNIISGWQSAENFL